MPTAVLYKDDEGGLYLQHSDTILKLDSSQLATHSLHGDAYSLIKSGVSNGCEKLDKLPAPIHEVARCEFKPKNEYSVTYTSVLPKVLENYVRGY